MKVSNFPYIDKQHFHGVISLHQPSKPGAYACRQEKGTFCWKLAQIGTFWGLDSEADGPFIWKIHN